MPARRQSLADAVLEDGSAPGGQGSVHRRRRTRALVLTTVAALLALLAGLDYGAWRREQARLAGVLEASGLATRYPEVAAEVRREPDRELARLRVARALFASELDDSRRTGAGEAARGLERLAVAGRLAAATLPHRPAAWRAPLVLGGAAYLELSRRHDPRLGAAPELWEAPLLAAHALAPSHAEPTRLLAAAYLGDWARLPPARRRAAVELVREAFEDARSFELLIEAWLRVAPSLGEALAVVPPQPLAWERLQAIFSERGDLERFRDAHQRWFELLPEFLAGRLAEAETRLRRGQRQTALERFASLATVKPDRAFAALLTTALARAPRGKLASGYARAFRTWLDWSADLCAVRGCPLPPAALERLRELAGEPPTGDGGAAATATGGLATGAPAAVEWPATAWQLEQQRARLVLRPVRPAAGLTIEVDRVDPDGCVVEARLDGGAVGFDVVTPGDRVRVEAAIDAGLHLLELVPLRGRLPQPGRVTLRRPG